MDTTPKVCSIAGHTFLSDRLGPAPVVLDLGACTGVFSLMMIRRFGALCYAVEANPDLCSRMPTDPRLRVFDCAICGTDGVVDFYISAALDASSLCSNTVSIMEKRTVRARRLDTFMLDHDLSCVAVLKVDVEGAEIEMFDAVPDSILARIAQITVEFHDTQGLIEGADAARVARRLVAAGFGMFRFSPNRWDCLFVNRALCRISRSDLVSIWRNPATWRQRARHADGERGYRTQHAGAVADCPKCEPR